MKNLYLMVGIPGSGKSTFLRNRIKSGKVISRDEIRFSLLREGEDYFSHENEVWNEYVKSIKEAIENEDNIYLDATHLSAGSRKKILNALGKSLKNVSIKAIFFETTLEECLKRNENRSGRAYVPPKQIENMAKSLSKPTFDEGFNEIFIYNVERNKIKVVQEG